MMARDTATAVTAFFNSYRAAFERFDAPAVAGHFVYPCHVTQEGDQIRLIPVATKPEWTGMLEQLLAMYRSIGVTSAHMLDLKTIELSPRLMLASLHWALHDATGRPLYDFDALYTLAEIEGGLRITALAHNELPRYHAFRAHNPA